MSHYANRPPTPVLMNRSSQKYTTPTRPGFKMIPKESIWTQTRLSRSYAQHLSPLSTVTNTEELNSDGKTSPVWTSDQPRRPLNVEWRKVCATSVFPILSEPPRLWDGSRQTMKDFIASLTPTPSDIVWVDWSENESTPPELDAGNCDNGMEWTESSETQPEDTAKTGVFDYPNWDEWMTDSLSDCYSYTDDAPIHQNDNAEETAPPATKTIEFKPNFPSRPTQSSIPDIWPTNTRNTRCREIKHRFRASKTSCT